MHVRERISRRPRWRLLLGLPHPCLISNSQQQQHQSFCKKTRSSGCCLLACTLTARRLGRGYFMPFPVSERLLSVSCSQCLQPSTAISLPNEPFIYITSGMFGLHESN